MLFQSIRNHFPFPTIIYGYIHPIHKRLFQLLPMLGIILEARNFPNKLLIDLMRSKVLPNEYLNSSWHIFRIPEKIRSADTFIDLSILYFDPDTYCNDDYKYPMETVENITQITKNLNNNLINFYLNRTISFPSLLLLPNLPFPSLLLFNLLFQLHHQKEEKEISLEFIHWY